MLKKILLWIIPFFGIFFIPSISLSDSPDPFTKSDGYNSGIIEGTFSLDITHRWTEPYYPMGAPLFIGNNAIYLDWQPGRTVNYLKAKNIYSEEFVWITSLEAGKTVCEPVADDNFIYMCQGGISAFDINTGVLSKSFSSSGRVFEKIAVYGGKVIGFTRVTPRAVAFDAASGLELWVSGPLDKIPFGQVIKAEQKLIFNANPSSGVTTALNIENGAVVWRITHSGSAGNLVYNPVARRIFDIGRSWSMDIDTGCKRASVPGWPFVVNNHILSYYTRGSDIAFIEKDLDSGATIYTNEKVVVGDGVSPSTAAMINGKIYLMTGSNRLLEFDLGGNCLNLTAPKLNGHNVFSGEMVIDRGRLLLYDSANQEMGYYDRTSYITASPGEITVSSPYQNTTNLNQYLGQLHSHYIPDVEAWSKVWNGLPTPEYTVNEYKKLGYDFIALTEHNQIVTMPVVDGMLQIQNAEESTQGIGKHHILSIGINEAVDDQADDQARINAVNAQGGIAVFAHPDSWVYGATTKTLNQLKGLKCLEVYNNAVYHSIVPDAYALDDFDKLLGVNHFKYLTAGDDYTPGDGFIDGGAVMVFANSNSQNDIMASLKSGNFYALQGSSAPKIRSLIVADNTISVEIGEQSDISFIGKGGEKLKVENDVLAGSYQIMGDEQYVRVEAKSKNTGKMAWSQPVLTTRPSGASSDMPGHLEIISNRAVLSAVTTEPASMGTVETSEFSSQPPIGYLSPIYSLETAGRVVGDSTLSVSYDNLDLPVNISMLSLYTYSEESGLWQKVESLVDTNKKIVTASLAHFSMYTLSAEEPLDNEPPTLELVSPTDLSNISDSVNLLISSSDNQTTQKVEFRLDGKFYASGDFKQGYWSSALDLNKIITGSHQLEVTAFDYSGNRITKVYPLVTSSGIQPLGITLSNPTTEEVLMGSSMVSGNLQTDLEVESLKIFLDEIFIADANVNLESKTFEKEIDWSAYNEGTHKVRLVLCDVAGNDTVREVGINISKDVIANIISPNQTSYFKNSSLTVTVEVVPSNHPVEILLDEVAISNNTKIELINYSIGEHEVKVVYNAEVISSKSFVVKTSWQDSRNITLRLLREGHIKQKVVASQIIFRITKAQIYSMLGRQSKVKKELIDLLSYINKQSTKNRPSVDSYSRSILQNVLGFLVKGVKG